MSSIGDVRSKLNTEIEKIGELVKSKKYDSAISALKDQIGFLNGYLAGEKDSRIIDEIYSVLRDRKLLVIVYEITKRLDLLENSVDERIANLVHKVSQIEKEFQFKKEGK